MHRLCLLLGMILLVATASLPSERADTVKSADPDGPAGPTGSVTAAQSSSGTNWPSFRGPRARGVAEGYPTATTWNLDSSENIKWRAEIPGVGHSSPVIWGDRIYLTTAISERDNSLLPGLYGNIAPVEDNSIHTWMIYCLDKETGQTVWEQTVRSGVPTIKRHTKSTHANPTVATDGRHVIAMFGSEGLYAYDMDGEPLWTKDLGVLDSGYYVVPEAQWGFSSSPVIFENMVIVQADVQENSFLAAFDITDGSEIWRTPRDDVPTFGTPTVHETGDGALLIVNGYRHIGGYDAGTGEELWRLRGGGDIPAPTPVVAHDLIFITNAHGNMSPIYAIRTSARGDISFQDDASSNEHIAWFKPREGAYMPTPVVYGDYLYLCRHNGILQVYEARTGEMLYRERLGPGGAFTASLVAADDKIYVTSEEGDVYVVKAGPEFELLATNSLGEVALATPAISEGILFFRTQSHVLAVDEQQGRGLSQGPPLDDGTGSGSRHAVGATSTRLSEGRRSSWFRTGPQVVSGSSQSKRATEMPSSAAAVAITASAVARSVSSEVSQSAR